MLVAGTKKELDRVFVSEALSLPTVSELLSLSGATNPVGLHRAREAAMGALAKDLETELREAWNAAAAEEAGLGGYKFEHTGVQLRALRNTALAFLARLVSESSLFYPGGRFARPDAAGSLVPCLSPVQDTVTEASADI